MEFLLAVVGLVTIVWLVSRLGAGVSSAAKEAADAADAYWHRLKDEMDQLLRFDIPCRDADWELGSSLSSVDFERMELELWEHIEEHEWTTTYLLRRAEKGIWESKPKSHTTNHAPPNAGKDGRWQLRDRTLSPTEWVDEDFGRGTAEWTPERAEEYADALRERTSWSAVRDDWQPLLDDRFHRVCEFFSSRPGLHPGMTDIEFGLHHLRQGTVTLGDWPATGATIWRPPVHELGSPARGQSEARPTEGQVRRPPVHDGRSGLLEAHASARRQNQTTGSAEITANSATAAVPWADPADVTLQASFNQRDRPTHFAVTCTDCIWTGSRSEDAREIPCPRCGAAVRAA